MCDTQTESSASACITTVLVIGFNANKPEFHFFQHLTNRKVGQRKTVQSNIITETCLGFEIIRFISIPQNLVHRKAIYLSFKHNMSFGWMSWSGM